jgi:hypothetical protein
LLGQQVREGLFPLFWLPLSCFQKNGRTFYWRGLVARMHD